MTGEPNDQADGLDFESLLETVEDEGFSAFLCRWKDGGDGQDSEVFLTNTSDIDQEDAEVMILSLAMSLIVKVRDKPGYKPFLDEFLKAIQP